MACQACVRLTKIVLRVEVDNGSALLQDAGRSFQFCARTAPSIFNSRLFRCVLLDHTSPLQLQPLSEHSAPGINVALTLNTRHGCHHHRMPPLPPAQGTTRQHLRPRFRDRAQERHHPVRHSSLSSAIRQSSPHQSHHQSRCREGLPDIIHRLLVRKHLCPPAPAPVRCLPHHSKGSSSHEADPNDH